MINFKFMKIGLRLGLGFVSILILLLILAVLNITQMEAIQQTLESIVTADNVKIEEANHMLDEASNMALDTRDLIFMTKEEDMAPVMAHYVGKKASTRNIWNG